LLTFSPCEAFLPIYASGVRYGWAGFALLTAILSVGTVAGMVLFTWLTLSGAQKIKLGFSRSMRAAHRRPALRGWAVDYPFRTLKLPDVC
jgi:hypothetical protein